MLLYGGLTGVPREPDSLAVLLVEVAAMLRTSWLGTALCVVLLAAVSRGEGLPAAGAAAEITADKIAALVEQLERAEFAERQAATQQLEEAGAIAIPQLEATAAAGSREAAGRAFDVLKQHFQSGSEELKLAAGEVLRRLAATSSASTAQRARDVLNPPQPVSILPPAFPPPGMFPPRNNFGGGWAPNPAPIAAPVRSVSISDINGRRVVTIDDRERRIRMETIPRGGIQVEVTDKQNARNGTRRIDARDVDDLKRKDAELGRLYEQHQGAGPRQLGAMGAMPLPFGMLPPKAATPAEISKVQLDAIESLLEHYKQRRATDPAAQRMIEMLEASKQRVKAAVPAEEVARSLR
ncbi:MAG TPA: hypothetical protein VKH44_03830 [Pirellulaceae bacterium]|nr:hypothetical protein [Pirellulaceae bacterium]